MAEQGYFISQLPPVANPATDVVGGLIEMELPIGPGGSFVNVKVTYEQLAALLGSGGDTNPGGPTADYVSTETLGGISAGDAFTTDDATLVKLLVKYQAPAFASFALAGAGSQTVEVGTPFGAGFKSFTWATSNPQNVTANSLKLRDVTGAKDLATNEANDGSLSASTAAYVATLGETRRYRLSGLNSKGGSFSADLVHAGETASYLGASTATTLNPTQLVALGSPQLQGSRGRSASGLTTSGGQYLYYAYDARHGDLTSIILDGAAPVLGAFQKQPDATVTNAQGAQVTLRVYRSNAPNAFTNNSLAFS
jgi:hypothetical protein